MFKLTGRKHIRAIINKLTSEVINEYLQDHYTTFQQLQQKNKKKKP